MDANARYFAFILLSLLLEATLILWQEPSIAIIPPKPFLTLITSLFLAVMLTLNYGECVLYSNSPVSCKHKHDMVGYIWLQMRFMKRMVVFLRVFVIECFE